MVSIAASFDLCESICWRIAGATERAFKAPIEMSVEDRYQHETETGDCQQTRDARYGIVDSRSRPSVILRNRVHYRRGERRYADRHSQPKDDDCREKCSSSRSRRCRAAQKEQSRQTQLRGLLRAAALRRTAATNPPDQREQNEHQQDER